MKATTISVPCILIGMTVRGIGVALFVAVLAGLAILAADRLA